MTVFDALILGMLQGLTEFLPVSSSGHLVLAQELLDVKNNGIAFEVVVHLGSLLAVLIYFRTRIVEIIKSIFDKTLIYPRKIILFIFIGSLPAVVAVLFFKDFFEEAFSNPYLTSIMLIITGIILSSTQFIKIGSEQMKYKSSIIMGIGQALAIMPGISRSGTTIAIGMMAKVKPSEAAEFSFLLSIPAILGAVLFKYDELSSISADLTGLYLIGLVTSFIFSLIAVYAVLKIINKGKFQYFGYYCLAAGVFGLYLFL